MKKHKNKIITAVIILAVLAFSFIYGGNVPEAEKASSQPPVEFIKNQEILTEPETPPVSADDEKEPTLSSPAVAETKIEQTTEETEVKEDSFEEKTFNEVTVKEETAKEAPVEEKPVKEEPVKEEPVKEEPVKEESVKEEPVKKDSVKEEPVKKESVKEEPVKEEPVKEEPVKEEPVKEEPVKEEPVKEEPVKKESVKEEPVKEEPVKEEPIKEEPIKEEPIKEEPVKEESVKEEPANEEPKQDNYHTDPVPSGMPKPIEPENVEISDKVLTCTLTVRCDTIINNISMLDSKKLDIVPKDGIIFAEKTVSFYEGESVFNLLLREMKRNKIHLEFVNTPIYNSAYIEGIANLYEFDCGELSGWMYKVNGWFPNYGCSRYQLKADDKVEWVYTCNLGLDVGGNYSARNGN